MRWLQHDGIGLFGLLRTENTLMVVVFSIFASRLFRCFSDKRLLIGGQFLYAAGYVYLAFGTRPWLLIAAMGLATMGGHPFRLSRIC